MIISRFSLISDSKSKIKMYTLLGNRADRDATPLKMNRTHLMIAFTGIGKVWGYSWTGDRLCIALGCFSRSGSGSELM